MSEKVEVKSRARREFLKTAGLGAGAVGATAIALSGKPAKAETKTGSKKAGYRATEHVKKYYDTSRF